VHTTLYNICLHDILNVFVTCPCIYPYGTSMLYTWCIGVYTNRTTWSFCTSGRQNTCPSKPKYCKNNDNNDNRVLRYVCWEIKICVCDLFIFKTHIHHSVRRRLIWRFDEIVTITVIKVLSSFLTLGRVWSTSVINRILG